MAIILRPHSDTRQTNYQPNVYPAQLWDLYGKRGLPIRATVSSLGPLLLLQLLELNDTQTGVLYAAFKIARWKRPAYAGRTRIDLPTAIAYRSTHRRRTQRTNGALAIAQPLRTKHRSGIRL
jgi:hypothetical protein